MALETEIKFEHVDLDDVATGLHDMGAERQGRWFEQNLVCDTADRALRTRQTLLRLRMARGKAMLTLKRPPAEPGPEGFKNWDEIETEVADCDAMQTVLQTLGYGVAFRYEKLREEWRLDGVVICLDMLPFGQFLELEGSSDAIKTIARRLGLDPALGTTATYHDLNRARNRTAGREERDSFTFSDAERNILLRAG